MNVAKADVNQRLQLLFYLRDVFKNGQRVGNWHLEQVSDRVAVVLDGQRLVIVAASTADLAEHVNIGQEIHFDAALAFALARFATSSGNVEGKTSGLIAALARLRQHGIEITNLRENSGVGRRIRARRAADWRLVDANDFVDVLRPHDRFMLTRLLARTVKLT